MEKSFECSKSLATQSLIFTCENLKILMASLINFPYFAHHHEKNL